MEIVFTNLIEDIIPLEVFFHPMSNGLEITFTFQVIVSLFPHSCSNITLIGKFPIVSLLKLTDNESVPNGLIYKDERENCTLASSEDSDIVPLNALLFTMKICCSTTLVLHISEVVSTMYIKSGCCMSIIHSAYFIDPQLSAMLTPYFLNPISCLPAKSIGTKRVESAGINNVSV